MEGLSVMSFKMAELGTLYVTMFGKFDMVYRGESLTGRRTSSTQFYAFMQMLIHFRDEGVSREFLERGLFEGKHMADENHALQSVMYNAKKRLQNAGLPDHCFSRKKGVYDWNPSIMVVEDAAVFEQYFERSMQEEDADKRLWMLLRTIYTYKGKFLGQYQSVTWVAEEAKRYQRMFRECMELTASILRGLDDYRRLKELGEHASKADPFQNWEAIAMEGLNGLGRYEEAVTLYEDTVELYLKENHMHPSQALKDLMRQAQEYVSSPFETLEEIQDHICEPADAVHGAYLCSFPAFQNIYRLTVRAAQRSRIKVHLMLCNIVDGNGNLKTDAGLDALSERLERAIQNSIRRGDAFTKYHRNQFLILLVNTEREDCRGIQNRISHHFMTERQRTKVSYYVSEAKLE